MAEAMPNARYSVIDGAGHLPTLEDPDAVNAVLEDFLDSVISD